VTVETQRFSPGVQVGDEGEFKRQTSRFRDWVTARLASARAGGRA